MFIIVHIDLGGNLYHLYITRESLEMFFVSSLFLLFGPLVFMNPPRADYFVQRCKQFSSVTQKKEKGNLQGHQVDISHISSRPL